MNVLICSLSRSGSSALYYLLMNSFRPEVEGHFEPRNVDQLDFNAKETTLVKWVTDSSPLELRKHWLASFDKIVALVRDPRDRLVSSLLFSLHGAGNTRMKEQIKILQSKELDPASISFLDMSVKLFPHMNRKKILQYLETLHRTHEQQLARCTHYFVFQFENIVEKNYAGLFDYLEIKDPSPTISFAARHSHGMRKKSTGDWKNWLLPSDVDALKTVFDRHLENQGYDRKWTLNPKQIIKSEHASGFVLHALTSNKELEARGLHWQD